jgi:hypothetical protein
VAWIRHRRIRLELKHGELPLVDQEQQVPRAEEIDLVDEGPSNSPGGDDHPYLARQLSVF